MTADPYRATATSPSNPADPGSWNRYAYVLADPVNYNDPSGMDVCVVGAGTERSPFEWVDCQVVRGVPVANGRGEGANNKESDWYDRQIEKADGLLDKAYSRALAALANPKCSGLFKDANGNPLKDASGNALDPTQVLKGLYLGYQGTSIPAYGTITFSYDQGSSNFATTKGNGTFPNVSVSGVYYNTATIDFNMYWFNLGFQDENAAVLLHELGHAINALSPGWTAGNSIKSDTFSGATSLLNQETVYKDCIAPLNSTSND